jgi:hypothetical protein
MLGINGVDSNTPYSNKNSIKVMGWGMGSLLNLVR